MNIFKQLKDVQELQKIAYQEGFEAGKKARDKEILEQAEKEEAVNADLEYIARTDNRA